MSFQGSIAAMGRTEEAPCGDTFMAIRPNRGKEF